MLEIFFCENNVSKGLESMIDDLKSELTDATVYIEPCLGHCTDCAETFFAIAEAEILYGDSPEELFSNIKDYYKDVVETEVEF